MFVKAVTFLIAPLVTKERAVKHMSNVRSRAVVVAESRIDDDRHFECSTTSRMNRQTQFTVFGHEVRLQPFDVFAQASGVASDMRKRARSRQIPSR